MYHIAMRSTFGAQNGGDAMMANKLRELRGDMSQNEVAVAWGISKSAWAMYERGERSPRDEIKVRIANFFGKSVQEIFFT